MTDAVKLEPCPFCGGTKLNVCETDNPVQSRSLPRLHCYAVSCLTRGCHGGIFTLGHLEFPTQAEAIAAWNRRAGLEAVRREALEEAAKVAESYAEYSERNEGIQPETQALIIRDAIRALAANPQEGAAEGEGQGKDHE